MEEDMVTAKIEGGTILDLPSVLLFCKPCLPTPGSPPVTDLRCISARARLLSPPPPPALTPPPPLAPSAQLELRNVLLAMRSDARVKPLATIADDPPDFVLVCVLKLELV